MKKVVAVIPVRYGSTRLSGKPLKKINGKPLIQIIYENVEKTALFSDVVVATDSSLIFDVVKIFGGKVKMTSSQHKCGTDRVAEICQQINAEIILNIQGDELFITKEPLSKLIQAFSNTDVSVATLIHPIYDLDGINNPNIVKVIFDKDDFAIYFSRSPIPYQQIVGKIQIKYYEHIGVYAFRKNALLNFATLHQSKLEKAEKLEQLRLIENGIKIKVVKTDYSGFSINTKEDLNKAITYMKY
ncbi:MAG: 3-deoxy-manno-octulosonate cytidylyltransferase [Candidatus Cloacimonetes bacterium]|nr:3-deoxy-manno-octulosonate cytidylyltransferase [Candidatus Cloacimonadota bacterium]MBL7086369.1 3-deoxy-manno-octulosonate cytidylyltransferase [Candidatus Cloacimonadota bacterium]